MVEGRPLERGDPVFVTGGYFREPEWLDGRRGFGGTLERFIPGQSGNKAAVVRTDNVVSANGVNGKVLVLELRYVDATWESGAIVHVELCDFEPESMPWGERRQGAWAEAAATVWHQE